MKGLFLLIIMLFASKGITGNEFPIKLSSENQENCQRSFSKLNEGSDFFRIKYKVTKITNFKSKLFIRDSDLDLLAEIPLLIEDLNKPRWSDLLFDHHARIYLCSENSIVEVEILDIKFFNLNTHVSYDSIVGLNNDIEEYQKLSYTNVNIYKKGEKVALLSFIDKDEGDFCTGFFIGNDLLITNRHCVDHYESCYSMRAVFGYEFIDRKIKLGPQLKCEAILEIGERFDYSLIKLRNTDVLNGGIKLKKVSISDSQKLVLIHHPEGEMKKVTINDCKIENSNIKNSLGVKVFTHTCDSNSGSSGSPLFNENGNVVGVHYGGIVKGDKVFGTSNSAIHINDIIEVSKKLKN